jgi:hypothetical protein
MSQSFVSVSSSAAASDAHSTSAPVNLRHRRASRVASIWLKMSEFQCPFASAITSRNVLLVPIAVGVFLSLEQIVRSSRHLFVLGGPDRPA